MRLASLFSNLALALIALGLAFSGMMQRPAAEQSAAAHGDVAPIAAQGTRGQVPESTVAPLAEAPPAPEPPSPFISPTGPTEAAHASADGAPVEAAPSAPIAVPSQASEPVQPTRDTNEAVAGVSAPAVEGAETEAAVGAQSVVHDGGTAAPAKAESGEHEGGTPTLRPAKVLFGAIKTPAPLAARAIGSYAKGCLAGGQALPIDGPEWQAMRLSRNRNWGHPNLIKLIERLAADGKEKDGWSGLLVGDIAQPRGGPMLTGHASHQIGLDADIWLTPMPDRRLSDEEREKVEAISLLGEDGLSVSRDVWTDAHYNILKRAASYPEVERIFIHPAIKQVLCHVAGNDRKWLTKVRPYWGHYYHFHIRMACPADSVGCHPQAPAPVDDGCGKEVEDWLKLLALRKPPPPPPIPLPSAQPPVVASKPAPGKAPMTLDQLPDACRVVLGTENPDASADIAAAEDAMKHPEKYRSKKLADKPKHKDPKKDHAAAKPSVAGAAVVPPAKAPVVAPGAPNVADQPASKSAAAVADKPR